MYWLKQNKKNLFALTFLMIAALPAILPLLHKGFFVTDDAEWMIIRLSAFYQAFTDGQIPVRYLGRLNHEYGYPVATFLYPGFMYLGSLIHLLKINIVDSVKIIIGLSMILSSVFTYLWLRKFFDKVSSIIGGVIYLYTPYHMYDLYKRGSVGELMAITILPFIMWQIERGSIFWGAFGIALLILSHNTLAFIFLILITGYMLLNLIMSGKKEWIVYLKIIFAGLGLAAFYWIPVLFELQNTVFAKTTVSDWRGYFANLDLIGYSTLFIFLSSIVLFSFDRSLLKKHKQTTYFIVFGVISVFLSSQLSIFIWNFLPASFIQFPFRFLAVSLLASAFIGAFIASKLINWHRIIFIFIAFILLSIPTFQYIKSIEYFDKGNGFYETNSATTTVHDEYMPVWVREKPTERWDEKVQIIIGSGVIENLAYDNNSLSFTADVKKNDAVIRINTIYWPGWAVRVNNDVIKINHNNPKGVMEINIPPGTRQVRANFTETPVRLLSDIISVISLCFLLYISFIKKKVQIK